MRVITFHECGTQGTIPTFRVMAAAAAALAHNEWDVCLAEIGAGTELFLRHRGEISEAGVVCRLLSNVSEIEHVTGYDFLFVVTNQLSARDRACITAEADLNVIIASLSLRELQSAIVLAEKFVQIGVPKSDIFFAVSARSREERLAAAQIEQALSGHWIVVEGFVWRFQYALECGRPIDQVMVEQLLSRTLVGEIARRGFADVEASES